MCPFFSKRRTYEFILPDFFGLPAVFFYGVPSGYSGTVKHRGTVSRQTGFSFFMRMFSCCCNTAVEGYRDRKPETLTVEGGTQPAGLPAFTWETQDGCFCIQKSDMMKKIPCCGKYCAGRIQYGKAFVTGAVTAPAVNWLTGDSYA